jgi:hypothetical protein
LFTSNHLKSREVCISGAARKQRNNSGQNSGITAMKQWRKQRRISGAHRQNHAGFQGSVYCVRAASAGTRPWSVNAQCAVFISHLSGFVNRKIDLFTR